MARALNKLDRMAQIEQSLGEADLLTDWVGELNDIMQSLGEAAEAAQNVSDYLQEAANSTAEAQSLHEDRQWEDRNTAIEDIGNHLERVEEALNTLEGFTPPEIRAIDDELGQVREKFDEAKSELDFLL